MHPCSRMFSMHSCKYSASIFQDVLQALLQSANRQKQRDMEKISEKSCRNHIKSYKNDIKSYKNNKKNHIESYEIIEKGFWLQVELCWFCADISWSSNPSHISALLPLGSHLSTLLRQNYPNRHLTENFGKHVHKTECCFRLQQENPVRLR